MKFRHMRFLGALIVLGVFFSTGQSYAQTDPMQWSPSKEQQVFLDKLQHDTFNFFWQTTDSETGLTPDYFPDSEFSSVAGVGFALSAYLVGIEHQYITREQGAERTLKTLRFLKEAPQGDGVEGTSGYKGFFYHFLNTKTGLRHDQSELSTIDTALLIAGVISSQTYFDRDSQTEAKIREYADTLYRRIDWTWAYDAQHKPLLSMGWRPESGFLEYYWTGYNEAMILYILAMGSPTHPIDAAAWTQWTATYHWAEYYQYPYVNFGPLFGHQYSHIWIDFRQIQDAYMRSKGIDYFINSKRATYANRAYCIDNPHKWQGYTDNVWGLTASEGPASQKMEKRGEREFRNYWARGTGLGYLADDGTIAPTAAGGSVPFAPEVAIPTLKYLYDHFGDKLYGEYGFKDAFNLSYASDNPWFGQHYLAIDQGPILLMIENYRSDSIWKLMSNNPYLKKGLEAAGFSGGWLARGRKTEPPPPQIVMTESGGRHDG